MAEFGLLPKMLQLILIRNKCRSLESTRKMSMREKENLKG